MSAKPIVAIVGRPNVGKSTLFNRLVGERMAIVEDKPGVTRDRLYGESDWGGREFIVIDTGGIEFNKTDTILTQTANQARVAMEEADVIIFVLDFRDGVTATDEEIAAVLRKTHKPVILAVNKGEGKHGDLIIYDFYALGLGEPILISSIHGVGTGDLLQEVVEHFPEYIPELYDEEAITVSLIGRPNVGKSSMVNALIGQERVIVSDIAGTTRDAIDTVFEREGEKFVFIDTAGMRKKSKVDDSVEYYSIMRSLRAVERSKVTLIVIEATAGVTEQDKRVAGYAHENGNALILVVNKWDLVSKETNTMKKMTKQIKDELLFMSYAPVVFVSALTKQRIHKIFDLIVAVAEQHARRIQTSILNEVIREATMMHTPPSDKGKRLKLYYATQIAVQPPTIAMFVNEPELMHFSYMRYLENSLREAFGFEGTPIHLTLRKKE